MLCHNLSDLILGHLHIGHLFLAVFKDFHHRLILTDADAAGLGYGDIFKASLGNFFGEALQYRTGTCRNTAGSHAHYHPNVVLGVMADAHLILHLVPQRLKLCQTFHALVTPFDAVSPGTGSGCSGRSRLSYFIKQDSCL